MRSKFFQAFVFFTLLVVSSAAARAQERPTLRVKKTPDFEITGDGAAENWKGAEWSPLHKRKGPKDYSTRLKTLYSEKGIYFLMEGADTKVTSTAKEDFSDLWTEDVFEVFLWTDERYPLYFEYEISPFNRELVILVPNIDDRFLGWRPWMYEGNRKIKKATSVKGGKLEKDGAISSWSAEIFIPYELLTPLANSPPKSGTKWRANFYRNDYDGGEQTAWDWTRVGESYHEFTGFGVLIFE